MAHFAELESKVDPTGFTSDTHLVVKRVIVVGDDIETAAGPLGENNMHVDGETWCANKLGGVWKQTDRNKSFRKLYAGVGYVYDPSKDKFIGPQPYASWALDAEDDWAAPVAQPDEGTGSAGNEIIAAWDEDNLRWIGTSVIDDDTVENFVWNPSTSAWEAA
jgi:hypothetical protein|tara:strand:- start:155 stop:640 length:486 start_codon:yes stop_codon:yes gene_type:complete